MSIDATIAVLYAQTGFAGRVAHDAATGPQAALAMSRVIASEMSKLEQQQVQNTEPGVEARVADQHADGRKGGAPYGSRRRSRPPPQPLEDTEPTPSETPLVGNLLNIKV